MPSSPSQPSPRASRHPGALLPGRAEGAPDGLGTAARDGRWQRWAPWWIALLAAATLPWSVHGWYDPSNDSSIYIACARALERGEGYVYAGEPFRVRPPGFSALIAPLLAWRGFEPYALNLFVSLWGVLSVALLFAWSRPRIGAPIAAAIAALVWLTPTYQRLANQTLSDVPGVACVFACLLLERWAGREPSTRRDVVLGLAIAAGTYLRTLLVLLLPALLVARWLSRREAGAGLWGFARTRALAVSATTILALLPWAVRNSRAELAGPAEQTMLASYWTGMWHVDEGDPSSPVRSLGDLWERTQRRSSEVASSLGTNLETSLAGPGAWIAGGVLVALALWSVWRRREAADVFFVLTLGVLLTYFAFEDRLMLPTWALAWPLAADGLIALTGRALRPERARLALALALAIAALVCAQPRRGWEAIAERDAAWRRAAAGFEAALPADARLASVLGGQYEVFLDRRVYNLGFALRRARGFAGAEAVLERREIDAVLAADADPSVRGLEPELARRFRVQPVPGGRVYWVRER